MKTKKSYQFCLSGKQLGRGGQSNLVNILLGLSSSPNLQSVVELSESEFFQYSYSSITKVLHRWECTHNEVTKFVMAYIEKPEVLSNGKTVYCLTHDYTKLLKPESHCLEDRTYRPTNNAVGGRKSISAGYPIAALHYDSGQSGHNPFISLKRLDGHENFIEVTREQVIEAMALMPKDSDLIILDVDSAYGCGPFLSLAYDYYNLLIVSRLQSGKHVFKRYEGPQKGVNGRIYGDAYTLVVESGNRHWATKQHPEGGEAYQVSINELACDEEVRIESETDTGRKIAVTIKRWNDFVFRTSKGVRMSDKPFDVCYVTVTDVLTGELVFDRPMWLCVAGKRKSDLVTQDVHKQYRRRYGVEPTYRFCKQRLLMGGLQTPVKEHLDNWLKICQLCTWHLYLVADEAALVCKKWQKYSKVNKQAKEPGNVARLTIAQAHNSAKTVISLYDLRPFAPLKVKAGKGRVKDTKMTRKTKHRILKKADAVAKYQKRKAETG